MEQGWGRSWRRVVVLCLLGAGAVHVVVAGGVLAQSDKSPAKAAGFDYWQPDWMVRELWGPGRMPAGMMVRLLRHTTFMQYGVPKSYDDQHSMVSLKPETIAVGRKVYSENCASCHGPKGLGNGDAGLALSPSPALLAYMIRRPIAVDEYLLWTISEGGKQFGSDMPAFKDTLAPDDIWRVVAYMRAGFPDESTPANEPKP